MSSERAPARGAPVGGLRARDVMTTPVETTSMDTPIEDAIRHITAMGFTALPVLDWEDRLVGIVTEADLLSDRITPGPQGTGWVRSRSFRPPGSVVGDVMTTPVESMTPGADAADIAGMMIEQRIRSVPIVDGDRVVGIVTRRDLLEAIIRSG